MNALARGTAAPPVPNMLADLVAAARRQTDRRRALHPEVEMRRRAAAAPPVRDLVAALRAPGLGVVAEMKPRSPSKGLLTDDYRPAELARAYTAGGAAAISVLTHEEGFGGMPEHLAVVRAETGLPVLRKDFVVEDYQLLEARALGADAVLLIVAALAPDVLAALLDRTRDLGMEALIEVHDAAEIDVAVAAGASVIGVNHRDLRTFEIDITLTGRLRDRVGPDRLLVAESGVTCARDARALHAVGADALLVGELLMRSAHPEETIVELTRAETEIGPPLMSSRFGRFGGRYVPETLMAALEELRAAWELVRDEAGFVRELREHGAGFVGRPTPLYAAERLTAHVGGARIHFKREDLCHTGAHKLNNALGQVLLARRMGKRRIIAETGAGQHGVATATVCARFGLPCVVYMGAEDMRRQEVNVRRMRLLGAEVRAVDAGSATLKDATSEAIRDWVATVRDTHYIIGSAVGPDPYPTLVRDLQCVIGDEARVQYLAAEGVLPDVVVACVGGGSNAIGMFAAFTGDPGVRLVGVEAGGRGPGLGEHAAAAAAGTSGVLHGSLSLILQDGDGQVWPTHSVAAGLDYPGVGPEHAMLADTGRAGYVPVPDAAALAAFRLCTRLEGIMPALETAHALHHAAELAAALGPDGRVLVCFSGRGDKDMDTVDRETS